MLSGSPVRRNLLFGNVDTFSQKLSICTIGKWLIQEAGKKVVLASGRPTYGVVPLARQLHLERYGSYILSFNGARITDCRTGQFIYNKTLPQDVIPDIYRIASNYPVDILAYEDGQLLSGFTPTKYSELESRINHFPLPLQDLRFRS